METAADEGERKKYKADADFESVNDIFETSFQVQRTNGNHKFLY
jgi:hypothetical protein